MAARFTNTSSPARGAVLSVLASVSTDSGRGSICSRMKSVVREEPLSCLCSLELWRSSRLHCTELRGLRSVRSRRQGLRWLGARRPRHNSVHWAGRRSASRSPTCPKPSSSPGLLATFCPPRRSSSPARRPYSFPPRSCRPTVGSTFAPRSSSRGSRASCDVREDRAGFFSTWASTWSFSPRASRSAASRGCGATTTAWPPGLTARTRWKPGGSGLRPTGRSLRERRRSRRS